MTEIIRTVLSNKDTLMRVLLLYSCFVSVITFVIYGIDKSRAAANGSGKSKRRVPERILLILAFLGGAPGAAAGMLVFRHKTKKRRFGILIPISVILWTLLFAVLFMLSARDYLL